MLKTSKYNVYIKVDENNNIINIDSNLTLKNTTDWILIDEGIGDKYSLAQGNYFEKPLRDKLSRFNYKYLNKKIIELTEEEKENIYPKQQEETITEEQQLLSTVILENAEIKEQLKEQQELIATILLQNAQLKGDNANV